MLMLSIEVALNLFGYSLAFLTKLVSKQQDTFLPMLFLVSSKEFGIASAAVETMRLNTALVIPSAFYAVVQMISSPIMVRIFKKTSRQENRQPEEKSIVNRDANIRKGFNIEIFSVLWMVIEAVIAIGAGILAHSLALVVFGIDSIIELVSGFVLLWRLWVEMSGENLERVKRAEKLAMWVVGISLLLLAVYITVTAVYNLLTHSTAESSLAGIGLAFVAVFLMFYLSNAKKKIGEQIGSKALKTDGSCSIVCAYMSIILLVGVSLTALFGWWWIDAISSLGLNYFVIKEGIEAVQEARGAEDT